MNFAAIKCAIVMFVIVICLTGVGSQPLESFIACRGCLHPSGKCFESGVSYPHGGEPSEVKCAQHKGEWNKQMNDIHGYTAIPNTIIQSRNLVDMPSMFVTPGDAATCAAACNKHNLSNAHEKCSGFVYDGYPSLPEGTNPSPSLIKDQNNNPAHADKIICSFKGEYPSSSEKHNAYGSVFFKNNSSNMESPRPPNIVQSMQSHPKSVPQPHSSHQLGSGSNTVGNYKGIPLPSNDNPTGAPLDSSHSMNRPTPELYSLPPQHLDLPAKLPSSITHHKSSPVHQNTKSLKS